MRELNVVLPGLIWPEAADYSYLDALTHAKYFGRLLNIADITPVELKYSSFIYANQTGEVSIAQNYANSLGLSGFASFLLVEPTHLRADRDRLLISESALLQLNIDEVTEVIGAINEHFINELEIYYINDNLWLMGLKKFDFRGISGFPIIDIVGENIDEYLPSGNNSLLIHKILNEIQMLLHTLELNQLRAESGLLPINSVWLWDSSPPKLPFKLGHFLSSNPELGFPIGNLGESLAGNIDTLLIDQLYFPCRYRDHYGWQSRLRELDQELALPLFNLIKSGKLNQLKIWVPSLNSGLCFKITRFNVWKFWRYGNLYRLFTRLTLKIG